MSGNFEQLSDQKPMKIVQYGFAYPNGAIYWFAPPEMRGGHIGYDHAAAMRAFGELDGNTVNSIVYQTAFETLKDAVGSATKSAEAAHVDTDWYLSNNSYVRREVIITAGDYEHITLDEVAENVL